MVWYVCTNVDSSNTARFRMMGGGGQAKRARATAVWFDPSEYAPSYAWPVSLADPCVVLYSSTTRGKGSFTTGLMFSTLQCMISYVLLSSYLPASRRAKGVTAFLLEGGDVFHIKPLCTRPGTGAEHENVPLHILIHHLTSLFQALYIRGLAARARTSKAASGSFGLLPWKRHCRQAGRRRACIQQQYFHTYDAHVLCVCPIVGLMSHV